MAILTVGFNPAIDRIFECPGFHIGGHQKARQVARLASGKSANVNRALALLGVDSIATGFVGADDLEFFHEQLMSAGPGRILCRFVEVGGKTRENITILDPKNHVETHIRDRGFSVTPEEASLLRAKIAHELKPGDVAIFSGSLCEDLPQGFFGAMIDLCMENQVHVGVDSSGEALRSAAAKPLWLLKPNVEELQQLLGCDLPDEARAIRDAATPLLCHIERILVSRGRHGAVLVTAQGAWSARLSFWRAPVRTVSCGDHLLAGFVAELVAGRDMERALRVAVAVATARAFSSRLDEFDRELMNAALDAITLESL